MPPQAIPSNQLKAFRLSQQMTQADMAAVLSISQSSYSRLEKSEAPLCHEKVQRLQEHFGKEVEALFPKSDTLVSIQRQLEVLTKLIHSFIAESRTPPILNLC